MKTRVRDFLIVSYSASSVAAGFLTVRNQAATENAAVAARFRTVRNPAATAEFDSESDHYSKSDKESGVFKKLARASQKWKI